MFFKRTPLLLLTMFDVDAKESDSKTEMIDVSENEKYIVLAM